MFRIADILELKLFGAFSRGVPNEERVIMQAWEHSPVELGRFFLSIGWGSPGGDGAAPFNDYFLWLGEMVLQPKQWVVVMTGPGKPTTYGMPDGEPPMMVMHWNRANVLFASENVVLILLHADQIAVKESPQQLLLGNAGKPG